jgi:hypothetical protein
MKQTMIQTAAIGFDANQSDCAFLAAGRFKCRASLHAYAYGGRTDTAADAAILRFPAHGPPVCGPQIHLQSSRADL